MLIPAIQMEGSHCQAQEVNVEGTRLACGRASRLGNISPEWQPANQQLHQSSRPSLLKPEALAVWPRSWGSSFLAAGSGLKRPRNVSPMAIRDGAGCKGRALTDDEQSRSRGQSGSRNGCA